MSLERTAHTWFYNLVEVIFVILYCFREKAIESHELSKRSQEFIEVLLDRKYENIFLVKREVYAIGIL